MKYHTRVQSHSEFDEIRYKLPLKQENAFVVYRLCLNSNPKWWFSRVKTQYIYIFCRYTFTLRQKIISLVGILTRHIEPLVLIIKKKKETGEVYGIESLICNTAMINKLNTIRSLICSIAFTITYK